MSYNRSLDSYLRLPGLEIDHQIIHGTQSLIQVEDESINGRFFTLAASYVSDTHYDIFNKELFRGKTKGHCNGIIICDKISNDIIEKIERIQERDEFHNFYFPFKGIVPCGIIVEFNAMITKHSIDHLRKYQTETYSPLLMTAADGGKSLHFNGVPYVGDFVKIKKRGKRCIIDKTYNE